MAAHLSREEVTDALIKVENEEDLAQTFKKFEKEQDHFRLSCALADVARLQEHIPKVITCLRTAVDPLPTEMSRASDLVHDTLLNISDNTHDDTEFFVKVIASFEPSDVKPLASIRNRTLRRKNALKVLESVMKKSPTLITGDLPRWLADHLFDQDSNGYTLYEVARNQAFQYLTFFATERVLIDALAIVMKNEHYKVDSQVWCCRYQNPFPQDLYNKLNALLAFVKGRNELINAFLPSVLVGIVAGYLPPNTD